MTYIGPQLLWYKFTEGKVDKEGKPKQSIFVDYGNEYQKTLKKELLRFVPVVSLRYITIPA